MSSSITTIIFDLGGVLVDWDPRYLYRDVFQDDARMERFLAEVCTLEWIREMDAGKSVVQAVSERMQRFPGYASSLALWLSDWDKTLRGPIEGTVSILRALGQRGGRLVALTNWSAETFPIARKRFEFLTYFEDVLVSGEHRMLKPDRAIFDLACRRWSIEPSHSLFIDDSAANIESAKALGFNCIHFKSPDSLRAALRERQLLP